MSILVTVCWCSPLRDWSTQAWGTRTQLPAEMYAQMALVEIPDRVVAHLLALNDDPSDTSAAPKKPTSLHAKVLQVRCCGVLEWASVIVHARSQERTLSPY